MAVPLPPAGHDPARGGRCAELERDDGIAANPPWTGDLDGMVKRRLVRLLVVPNRTDYYLDHGEPKGSRPSMPREFERRLNRRFQTGARPIRVVFVPVARDELLPGLHCGQRRHRSGEPDDHAGAPSRSSISRRRSATDVREIVVTGPDPPRLTSLDDLAGREILTRRSSSYWPSLEALNGRLRADGLIGPAATAVLEAIDDEDLLELVASGRLPLAVVDDHKARAWQRALPTLMLRDDLVLRSGGDIAWAFRKNSPQLADSLTPSPRPRPRAPSSAMSSPTATWWLPQQLRTSDAADRKRFLELLALFEKWGERYRFDPLLLAAQGYQEFGARPEAPQPFRCSRHHADPPRDGARPECRCGADRPAGEQRPGRRQISPPPDGRLLRRPGDRRFRPHAPGAGRLQCRPQPDRRSPPTRRQARARPDRWFGEVELQAERDLGRETVAYVGNIVKYYMVYRGITEQEEARRLARTRSWRASLRSGRRRAPRLAPAPAAAPGGR